MKSTKSTLALSGLTIEIHSPVNLPFLAEKRMSPFQKHERHSDLCWNYQILAFDAQDSPFPIGLHDLPRARISCLGDGGKLIGKLQVQACLQKARRHAEWLSIEIHHGALAILDFKENRADTFFSPDPANELGGHGIGPAMLAPFLPNFAACLLHAAAVVRNGKAAVFLAPDEGGKTTAARLSPDGTILSDDQVLVRLYPSGFKVSGTPWGLHVDSGFQAPLAGLFLLEKARDFSLTSLSALELIPYLWEEAKNYSAIMPKPLKKKAFALVCDLAAAVPIAKLSFQKNHIDWQALDRIMAG
jgi:hypothetical protein